MSDGMLHFMDSPQSDELAEFLYSFDFQINGFGMWRNVREKPIVRGYICDFQLAYIVSGKIRIEMQQEEFICCEGTLVLFEPFIVYSTEILSPSSDFHCYAIHFDINPEYRKRELVMALLGDSGNIFTSGEMPAMTGMFNDLYQSKMGKEMGLILQTGLHLRLICLNMLRARWPKGFITLSAVRPNSSREAEVVKKSIRYIQENITHPLRIRNLSLYLSISENYLYKCFINVYQMPPSRYILQYKIRLSVEMMTSSGSSMEEIADALGFSSPYHFSRTFKQIMGCSPRNYVNRLSKGML